MSRLVAMFVLCASLGACTPPPPHATSEDALRMRVDLAELDRGRTLLVGKCGGCHTVPSPAQHTPEEWPTKLTEMAERSKLDPTQQYAIQQYLLAVLTRTASR